jgi:hypothetical protein
MKPGVAMVAAELATRLRTDLMAELTGFRANVAAMGAELLDMIAEQWDGAAANLVSENQAIRALLRQGGKLFGDSGLIEGSGGDDADLRISSLQQENERLRHALIGLHERVEADASEAARRLEDSIWDLLRRSVEIRRVGSANF